MVFPFARESRARPSRLGPSRHPAVPESGCLLSTLLKPEGGSWVLFTRTLAVAGMEGVVVKSVFETSGTLTQEKLNLVERGFVSY